MQPTKKTEKGITLIALIATIIIMVILTAVVIHSITGDNPLIGTSSDTAENYKEVSYKEEISYVVHSEIVAKSTVGEIATTTDLVNALNSQEWIEIAYKTNETTEEEGNIIAKVKEGYIYQIYYSSIYGKIEVDYVGKDIKDEDISSLTLTVRYDKETKTIYATAEDKNKGVSKIEFIYMNEILDTKENPSRRSKLQSRRK